VTGIATVMSYATVIIGTTTKPSSSKRAITTGMSTMIANLLLSTDSNRILAAPKNGGRLFVFRTAIVALKIPGAAEERAATVD
jgi:hypothetical protein